MRQRLYDINGKTVVITGAARGIGAATARLMARRGAKLALLDIDPEPFEGLCKELGDDTAWFEADVADLGQLDRVAQATVERFGGIDVVVANAGIAPIGTIKDIDPEAFERTIDVNLLGVWRTVRATLDHVIKNHGYVMSVASIAAIVNPPLLAHYAAAKAGVDAFSNSLRTELSPHGVDVGVAYFYFVDTGLKEEAIAHPQAIALRERLGSLSSWEAPAERAAQEIVRGIERRSRAVFLPHRLVAAPWLPAVFQRITDRLIVRKAGDVLRTGQESWGR